MTPLSITVTPSQASEAYRATDSAGTEAASAGAGEGGFGGALSRAISGVVDASRSAEGQAMQAIAGGGNLTDVVTAVSKAELALQTATTIRDRMVQAYQDIMRMPI
jgi:flagellar hook-basal body complex protein FliE